MQAKRFRTSIAAWGAPALAVLLCLPAQAFEVDCDIPAGNIIVDSVDGDTVRVRQDLRDSEMWFYWAFRVRGAQGRTVRFEFSDKTWNGPVGVRGPVVTTDRGKTFSYPLDGKSRMDGFEYSFGPDDSDVRFYECHPYVRADWDRFAAECARRRPGAFAAGTLCKSRKGADVPLARFGCIGGKPALRVFMSARHHASETVASWVLEGAGAAFLADDDLGRRLRESVELTMVPFVDYDGSQAGDQGKNRRPHDHNRDYSDFIYPETAAIRDLLLKDGRRTDAMIDVHCPWLRGQYNEFVYTPLTDPAVMQDPETEALFSATLEKVQGGALRYRAADDLPYGKAWNSGGGLADLTVHGWACRNLKGLRLARSLEVPFANANGAVVTPEACRSFGRDVAAALAATFVAR